MYTLDEREAFQALSLFVNQFAERAGDDLLTLLADLEFPPRGRMRQVGQPERVKSVEMDPIWAISG